MRSGTRQKRSRSANILANDSPSPAKKSKRILRSETQFLSRKTRNSVQKVNNTKKQENSLKLKKSVVVTEVKTSSKKGKRRSPIKKQRSIKKTIKTENSNEDDSIQNSDSKNEHVENGEGLSKEFQLGSMESPLELLDEESFRNYISKLDLTQLRFELFKARTTIHKSRDELNESVKTHKEVVDKKDHVMAMLQTQLLVKEEQLNKLEIKFGVKRSSTSQMTYRNPDSDVVTPMQALNAYKNLRMTLDHILTDEQAYRKEAQRFRENKRKIADYVSELVSEPSVDITKDSKVKNENSAKGNPNSLPNNTEEAAENSDKESSDRESVESKKEISKQNEEAAPVVNGKSIEENTNNANVTNIINKSVQAVKSQIVLLSHIPKFPSNLANNVITMPDGRKGLLLPPTNAILNSTSDATALAEKSKGRHNIRKIIEEKKLNDATLKAGRIERERCKRVAIERQQHKINFKTEKNKKYCSEIALSKKDKISVLPVLARELKPHQVEAVEFLWDNIIESTEKFKNSEGSGCILAHCMGLGKSLSIISLLHTLLKNNTLKVKSILLLCPLNTVHNWLAEWKKWLEPKDRVLVHEIISAKDNILRNQRLNMWKETGGVMLMGYQMFRMLVNYSGKSRKKKALYLELLIDPGPDIVACDEGHVLKNEQTSISKSLNRVVTKRRIVLTGTPLQNNLLEYHTMLQFVKPNLLGTRKEFCNRFVNPITNGQHSDSTSKDVQVMKRRAHVLHDLLGGCVQRRDYSALVPFLPPKHEYIIAVRLTPIQMKLYEEYLKIVESSDGSSSFVGVQLFVDYNYFMCICTHPWMLKLDEIRQDKKNIVESDEEEDFSFSEDDSFNEESTKKKKVPTATLH